jgi:beta-galactosidase
MPAHGTASVKGSAAKDRGFALLSTGTQRVVGFKLIETFCSPRFETGYHRKKMNKEKFAELFPLGTHLCREPMPPMAEMKRDMENLKKHGFNLIKLQEHWMVDEPREGYYDFSRYEELIEAAARLDLGVYIGLTCEGVPHWFWQKNPDSRMVGRNGVPLMYEMMASTVSDSKPGPCFDHPGAMNDMRRFITRLVQVLGKYENVVAWDIWQEIEYPYDICFCEYTLAFFREWLRGKYGNLDGLNRAWRTRYPEWAAVSPSRSPDNRRPYPVDIAWQYFKDNVKIGRVLQARAEAIRAADPLQRIVFAHKGGPDIGSGRDWTYARCQDFLGSSCYPAWVGTVGHAWDDRSLEKDSATNRYQSLLNELWEGVVLKFDYIWSCNRPGADVWAAEFQGGPSCYGLSKGRVPSPEDIRRWMLAAVGCGVNGICFWVTRAEIAAAEAYGYSLLDSEGDSTPRYEEAARIGAALNKHADLFAAPTRPRSKIAILIDELNYQFCMATAIQQQRGHLAYSVRGWHRLLWDLGLNADFVEISELDEEYAKKYKVFILPFPICLAEDVAQKLVRHVENGGVLISEVAPGRIDENAFCRRGEMSPAMRELFKVRQKSFGMIQEPANGKRWSPQGTWDEYFEARMLKGTGSFQGHELRPNVYLETFTCEGSAPCWMYGDETAAVVRKAGKGMAWLIGTCIGHNGMAYRDAETRRGVMALLTQAGVKAENRGKLLLRKRVSSGKEAWFFINPTEQSVTERVDVKGWDAVEKLSGDPLIRDGDSVLVPVDSMDIKALILIKKEKAK